MAARRRRRRSRAFRRTRAVVLLSLAAYGYVAGSDWYDTHRTGLAAALPWLFPAAVLSALAVLVAVTASRIFSAKQRAEADRLLATADACTDGRGFEQLVGRLYERDGCRDVRAGGGAGDLGADVVCRTEDGRKVVTQCKRYAADRTVGSHDMQAFLGTVYAVHRADLAVFVTTARFTPAASALGKSQGVVLVDRERLATWQSGRWTPSLAPTLTSGGTR